MTRLTSSAYATYVIVPIQIQRLEKLCRLLKYNLTCLVGIGLNCLVLWVLTNVFGIYYLASNLAGIAAAVIWNYNASVRLIWVRKAKGEKRIATPQK